MDCIDFMNYLCICLCSTHFLFYDFSTLDLNPMINLHYPYISIVSLYLFCNHWWLFFFLWEEVTKIYLHFCFCFCLDIHEVHMNLTDFVSFDIFALHTSTLMRSCHWIIREFENDNPYKPCFRCTEEWGNLDFSMIDQFIMWMWLVNFLFSFFFR